MDSISNIAFDYAMTLAKSSMENNYDNNSSSSNKNNSNNNSQKKGEEMIQLAIQLQNDIIDIFKAPVDNNTLTEKERRRIKHAEEKIKRFQNESANMFGKPQGHL